jgi:hypothetical protein
LPVGDDGEHEASEVSYKNLELWLLRGSKNSIIEVNSSISFLNRIVVAEVASRAYRSRHLRVRADHGSPILTKPLHKTSV